MKMNNTNEKMKIWWMKNRGKVLFVAGLLLGAGAVTAFAAKKNKKPEETIESEPSVSIGDISEEKKTSNPTMPCGAEIVWNNLSDTYKTSEDTVSDFDSMAVNDVPVSSMGEFGKEFVDLCRAAGMEQHGWHNMDNAMVSMIVTVQSNEKEPRPEEVPDQETGDISEEEAA